MTDGEDSRIGERRPYGFARPILVLGAILCAAPVLAQPARLAEIAAPGAKLPPVAAAPVPPAVATAAKAAPAATPAAPPAEESNPAPRVTDALLPSALPRD